MNFYNNLFKPFQRLIDTDEFPGTGISLETVAHVIQRHEGKIWNGSDQMKMQFFASLSLNKKRIKHRDLFASNRNINIKCRSFAKNRCKIYLTVH